MREALKLHPDSTCDALTRIEAELTSPRPGKLALHYILTGKMSDLRLPPGAGATRTDGLWRHTCFEAFFLAPHNGEYYEFNFSPSTQWAAYHFGGYRNDMTVAVEMTSPRIQVQATGMRCELQASIDLTQLPMLPHDAEWRLGLSAVIEETNGGKSYWALLHPAGKPDFHHADCFARQLPKAWYA
jgi:hypothetical protein